MLYEIRDYPTDVSEPVLTQKEKRHGYAWSNKLIRKTETDEKINLINGERVTVSTVTLSKSADYCTLFLDYLDDIAENIALVKSGILPKLIKRALQESPSDDWRRELDEM